MNFKLIPVLFFALVYFNTSHAQDNTCEKTYGETIKACATGLDSLTPNMRAGAQKVCVNDAKVAKDYCAAGVNVCLNQCQTNYDGALSICELDYQFYLENCSGNLLCVAFVESQKSACISTAVSNLDSCNAACQL